MIISEFSGFSVTEKNSFLPADDSQISRSSFLLSQRVDEPYGHSFVHREVYAIRETALKTPAVLPKGQLAQKDIPGLICLPHYSQIQEGPSVVAGRREIPGREVFIPSEPKPGMGSSFTGPGSCREVVARRKIAPHQCKGAESVTPGSSAFCFGNTQQNNCSPFGQHNGTGLHKEPRKHTLFLSLPGARDLLIWAQNNHTNIVVRFM